MTKKVAWVTCEQFADPIPEEKLAFGPMRERGMDAVPLRWDEPADWPSYAAVVIRSPWDYYRRPDEFRVWLDTLEGANVWNPLPVLRWNMNKLYLRQLAGEVNVVPTEWLGNGESVVAAAARNGWERVVVKPSISAGAYETFNGAPAEMQEHADRITADDRLVMLQEFNRHITEEGEWSLFFYGGDYAGAVLKRPAGGDYRVQMQYGGLTDPADAPPHLVEQAAKVLVHAPGDLLYARVDGVRDGDRFLLMELEVLEPFLFFHAVPGSPERFADALAQRLR